MSDAEAADAEAIVGPPLEEWLQRCAAARAADQPIPASQLFRRMLSHDDYYSGAFATGEEAADSTAVLGGPGLAVDVYCAAHVAEEIAGPELQRWSGLQLTAVIAAETSELRLFFDAAQPPLVLAEDEVAAFRSFLQVTVVEQVLTRLQAGDEMPVDAPFARLREFDGFLTVCAGGHGQPRADGKTPLKMALAEDAGAAGRRLAAVFTAEDALQLFIVSRSQAAQEELVSVRLSGRELFGQVASNDEIDGLVFNPMGPTAPVALARGVADVVLQGE